MHDTNLHCPNHAAGAANAWVHNSHCSKSNSNLYLSESEENKIETVRGLKVPCSLSEDQYYRLCVVFQVTSSRSSLHSSGSPHQQHPSDSSSRIPPQRVQSQTLYDRQNKWDQNGTRRPNTAQGFHDDQNSVLASIASLSHTETSV